MEALAGSFVNHVCEQRKHNNVQTCESQQHGFVRKVVENSHVINTTDCEEYSQCHDQWRQQSHWGEIHPRAQDQLCESQRVSDWFDVALADSLCIADRCEFDRVAIAKKADGDRGGEAETIRKKFEKIK